jgi:hypothetical protein
MTRRRNWVSMSPSAAMLEAVSTYRSASAWRPWASSAEASMAATAGR